MKQQFKIQDQIDKLHKKIAGHEKEIDTAKSKIEVLQAQL